MYYQPGVTDHGLKWDPFKACVVPRPIGWISTKNSKGECNLAPYSQFNNLTFDPPYVMFSGNQTEEGARKDTVVNVEETGHFVWNLATWDLREKVNLSAEQVPYGVDEFEHAGVEKEEATLMDVPMVKPSPVKFECIYHSTIRLPGNFPVGSADIVIGKVVAIHIDDSVLDEDGRLDIQKTQPIARCGYYQFAVIRDVFEMKYPTGNSDEKQGLFGLEGNMAQSRLLHNKSMKRAKTPAA